MALETCSEWGNSSEYLVQMMFAFVQGSLSTKVVKEKDPSLTCAP